MDDDGGLGRSVELLVQQVTHWEAGRWSVAGRGDRVHALVQQLADAAATAEGGPHRDVPRLADMVLPDQLRVMAADLTVSGASAEVLTRAAAAVDAVRRAL